MQNDIGESAVSKEIIFNAIKDLLQIPSMQKLLFTSFFFCGVISYTILKN